MNKGYSRSEDRGKVRTFQEQAEQALGAFIDSVTEALKEGDRYS